ncbi:MAG: NTP transferase domain-containing protein [Candidatus Eisenbacteria bacterium]|nr:NTP transferase domain-containing protein [Candidatus Eisenbacteria bacterium]
MLEGVILAGGRGTRFWPLSRRDRPKQLLRLFGGRSLLAATWERLRARLAPEDLWITTAADLADGVRAELPAALPEHLIPEPVGRNTAPAAAVVAALGLRGGRDPLQLVTPADHWIPSTDDFWSGVERARVVAEAADSPLVTFGVPITRPETGYGYIERGGARAEGRWAYRVAQFHEKPNQATAEAYLASGRCYWNAGIFLWRASAFAAEVERCLPDLWSLVAPLITAPQPLERLPEIFARAPAQSIDYGVLEASKRVAVVATDFAWSDLGNWSGWGELAGNDAQGNARAGETVTLETRDCVLHAEEGLIATLGISDLIVVRSGAVTLVADRKRAQDVRDLLERLREQPGGERHL